MKSIRFIGDIHGEFAVLHTLADDKSVDKVVQVGDCGIGFGIPWPDDMPEKVHFIRGNHDCREQCELISNYIPDGTTEDGIMYVGGAWSIDFQWRTPGVNWWHDEELSDYEFEDIFEKYVEYKPHTMVSHDLPQGINDQIIPLGRKQYLRNRTNFWLREMWNAHKPDLWICGHHHPDKGIVEKVEGTEFIVLPINGYIDIDYE